MFWVILAFAMALLALEFAFICFLDQFADRVKRSRTSPVPLLARAEEVID